MKIYYYNFATKLFTGEGNAQPDQMQSGKFIIPAFATEVQPPFFDEGKQAYWNGSAWEIQNVPPPEPEPQPEIPPITWEYIRAERDGLLFNSDWAVLPDADPKPSKQAWLDYRQALRDVPQNFPTPESVVWPQKP